MEWETKQNITVKKNRHKIEMTYDHEEKIDTNNNNRDTTKERPI